MKSIDDCKELRKQYHELQTQCDALQNQVVQCHELLDTAGVQASPDLQVRVRSILTAATLGSFSLGNTMETLQKLIEQLERFNNG